MTQPQRYQRLVNAVNAPFKGREENTAIDSSYAASLYLISASSELSQKLEKYISREGIDFPAMLRNERFSAGYLETIAQTAHNLFSWGEESRVTPHELACVPALYMKEVCNALMIAGDNYTLQLVDNKKDEPTLQLDDTPLKDKSLALQNTKSFMDSLSKNTKPQGQPMQTTTFKMLKKSIQPSKQETNLEPEM